jgi:5-methylcytosine-specific restriction endonuclease McrA
MRKHTKIYLEYFGYDLHNPSQYVPCERCTSPSTDIHHLTPRGMGGDPTGSKDTIENLVALCRNCHNIVERDPEENESLRKRHLKRLGENFF